MVPAIADPVSATQHGVHSETCVRAYRCMLLGRMIDDKLAALYRAGKIHGGVYLGRGQEALSASIGIHLQRGDVFAPLIRDSAGRVGFGEPILDVFRTWLGSVLGPMRGRDGNVHRGRPKDGLLPMVSHLGSMISVVNGILLARRMKGVAGTVGVASAGDGMSSTGAFHEALNQAAVERLPTVVVLADNQYAYSTPTSRQFACGNLVDRAVGYGLQGHTVNGTSLVDCVQVVGESIRLAREGRGPQLVVARLLRLCGHGEHDDAGYVDPKLKQAELGRDCLRVAEEQLIERGWMDAGTIEVWRTECAQLIEETIGAVQREPAPDPLREDWCAMSSRELAGTHPPG